MLVHRTFEAEFINAVANSPDCLGGISAGSMKTVDYTPVVKNHNNVVLVGDHGGIVFHAILPGFFELHTQVLLTGRGEWARQMAEEAVRWIFTRTDATELITRVPQGNKAAGALTRSLGGVAEAVLESSMVHFSFTLYRLTIQDWMNGANGLVEMGQWFHSRLHQEYAKHGIEAPIHEEDSWHNRHVGAAAYMILGNKPAKGIGYYNRWAAMAMAPFATLLSLDPLVIDIRDARLLVANGSFEVIAPEVQ
jgi:hypothetical protein